MIPKIHKFNVEDENVVFILDNTYVYVYVKHRQYKIYIYDFQIFNNYIMTYLNTLSFQAVESYNIKREENIDTWIFRREEHITVYISQEKVDNLIYRIKTWKEMI